MDDQWFEGVDDVVEDELRFKAKLGIGEDAYTSTRVKKLVFEAWDVAGVAATGAQVASSAFIAQKFFAAPGLLAAFGIGTAATPVGWVIAASVLTGGAWLGITRYLKDDTGKTTVIPDFINTPLDVLGLALFDLMAPLAMKVAAVDGHIHENETATIKRYFVRRWGYSDQFVDRGIEFISQKLDAYDIKTTAATLGAFTRDNPDCKANVMLADITSFLRVVMEADGRIDEREEMAIERVEKLFSEEMRISVSRSVAPVGKKASKMADGIRSGVTSAISKPWKRKEKDT